MKRKRGCDSHGADGGVVEVAAEEEEGGAAGLGRTDASSNGSAPGQISGKQSSPATAASEVMNGGKPGGAGEQRDAAQQQQLEGGRPPQTDALLLLRGACRRERCECPCFCGRRDAAHGHTAGRSGVDVGSRSIARVGTTSADLSRVEQLVGGAAMIRGCALGVGCVARATYLSPGLSVSGALDLLDAATAARDKDGDGGGEGERRAGGGGGGGGLMSLLFSGSENPAEGFEKDKVSAIDSFCGGPLVALPRRFEVAAALHRLPGVKFRPAAAAAAAVSETGQSTSPAETAEEEAA